MNEEKYEVSLEINTNKFNKQCDEVEKRAKKIADLTDLFWTFEKGDYLERIPSGTKEELQQMENDYLDRIGKLNDWYEASPKGFDTTKTFRKYSDVYNKNLDMIQKALGKFKDGVEEADEAVEELNEDAGELGGAGRFKAFFANVDKGFEKSFKKMKRFTMGLLGVRSAYFAMNRAMHQYLQNDKELSDKMQSIWTALGVIMAPIVEFVADLTLKLSKYVLYIAKVLTGVDLLQRAMDKTQKKMNKSLSSIDEITNIDEQSNLATLADMLDKTEINTAWADKLANAIKPIYEMIKGIVQFSLDHPEIIATILGGWAVMNLIGNILGNPTAGLIGISTTLAIMAGISIAHLIDEIKEYKKQLDSLTQQTEGEVELNEKWADAMIKAYEAGELKGEALEDVVKKTEKSIDRYKERLDEARRNNFFGEQDDNIKNLSKSIETMGQTLETLTGRSYQLEIEAKLDDTKFVNGVNNIGNTLSEKIGGFVSWAIGGFTEHSLDWWVKNYSKLKNSKKENYRSYDVGTNYVPNDQLAMIHEGEAIVPKKFNSKEFFGNGADDETKDMLFEIIDLLRENNQNVPTFNIDGREFAKATYPAYKSEEKRLGVNTSVERS